MSATEFAVSDAFLLRVRRMFDIAGIPAHLYIQAMRIPMECANVPFVDQTLPTLQWRSFKPRVCLQCLWVTHN